MSQTVPLDDLLNPSTAVKTPSVQSGGLLNTSPSTEVAAASPASPAPVLEPSDVGITQPTTSDPVPQPGVDLPSSVDPNVLADDSVSNALTGLLKTDSPFLQQARTRGLQAANRRGLLNSSIGTTASESAAIEAAFPVASQEAQQRFQTNIAKMNIAAAEREKATAAVVAMANNYAEVFRTIASNENIPADARNRFLSHISALRDSNFNLVEQLYGVDLDWTRGAPVPKARPPAPTSPSSSSSQQGLSDFERFGQSDEDD